MNTRERFHAVMNFEPFDRLPLVEWASWWTQTLERWRGEGMPPELTDRYEICRHFGLECYKQDWLGALKATVPQPAHHGAGVIATEAEYEALLPHLFPEDAVDEERWARWAEEQARGDVVLWFTVDGFFWFPRRLLGIERHLYAFYDQPQLMQRINEDLTAWILRMVDRICAVCTPDFMTFGEDMSYNHGPMLSEAQFDEFLLPWYRRVVPLLKERGIRVIADSDGDISKALPWFQRAGVEGLLPLERQAGVDVGALRARHPGAIFMGCYDKMVMNRGEAAMREEFERLLPVAAGGELVVSCDHQTPPGVSYDQYRLYMRLFREYAEEAGRMSRASSPD